MKEIFALVVCLVCLAFVAFSDKGNEENKISTPIKIEVMHTAPDPQFERTARIIDSLNNKLDSIYVSENLK